MSKFLERCSKIDCSKANIKPLNLTPLPYNWHTQYLDEAPKCFHNKLPICCIVVSSALVETCLCWENWRRKPEEQRKHIKNNEFRSDTLTPMFKKFLDSDIPLNKLVDSDEDIETLRKLNTIGSLRYIRTRNKFVHGDLFYNIFFPATLISGHEKDWLDYGIDNFEEWTRTGVDTVAYVHLLKTLRFIKAFTDLLIEKK